MSLTAPVPDVAADAWTPSPTEWLLSAALVVAPLVYLAADSLYAVRGWDDPAGAVLHVLGATGYGFVVWRIASWLPRTSLLAAVVVFTGVVGLAGNVAYGFDTIHQSLGDVALVDRDGAAVLIKPLGLFFPLWLVAAAGALAVLERRWQAGVVLAAAVAWPVAHIANLGPLAVVVNVLLVVGLGSLLWRPAPASYTARASSN